VLNLKEAGSVKSFVSVILQMLLSSNEALCFLQNRGRIKWKLQRLTSKVGQWGGRRTRICTEALHMDGVLPSFYCLYYLYSTIDRVNPNVYHDHNFFVLYWVDHPFL
jgi:hypothetical protein